MADSLEHTAGQPRSLHAVAVVTQLDAPTQRALLFAEALRPRTLVALNVCVDGRQTNELIAQWARRRIDIPLTSVYAAGRDPVVEYVDGLRQQHPAEVVMVVLPVVAVPRWWQRPLHRPSDPSLHRRLARFDRVMITEVP